MDNSEAVTCIEWFYGGGGNHRALRRVIPNLRVAAACEIEAFAVANLVAEAEAGQVDSFPVWTDCKTFPLDPFRGLIDLFVASYPCQGFSVAGQRRGKSDSRFLWPWVFRAVVTIRPRHVFFENVEGHISLGLSTVLSDLEVAGYKTAWGIFSAAECGASHRRKRVFILGELADSDGSRRPQPQRSIGEQRRRLIDSNEDVDNATSARRDAARSGPAAMQQGGQCVSRAGREFVEDASSRGLKTGKAIESRNARCKQGNGAFTCEPRRELGDADEPGLEGRHLRGCQCADEWIAGERERALLPKYPPGPNDIEGWKRVLALRPDLAPALSEAECALCGMADELAYRTDRLRMLGNGVAPDTAAKAFLTLHPALSTP